MKGPGRKTAPAAAWAHKTAIIDGGAKLGPGTKVWHFCHVMPGARIGRNCVLGQNVFVAGTVTIGDGCKVQNNVSLYDGVILHNNVFVGPSAVFTNVINPRAAVERKTEFKKTEVEEGATIGANATIVCGNRIGANALVGAGAVVTRNVPPHALVAGVPARRIGWICHCGVTLPSPARGRSRCRDCGTAYRVGKDGVRPVLTLL